MTNEQLDRMRGIVNRAVEEHFGKVGIPIEEKRNFSERVVREIAEIVIDPASQRPKPETEQDLKAIGDTLATGEKDRA
jgi:hypothetical protein